VFHFGIILNVAMCICRFTCI